MSIILNLSPLSGSCELSQYRKALIVARTTGHGKARGCGREENHLLYVCLSFGKGCGKNKIMSKMSG